MRQHRQLFALLLVAVYAIASTFGMALVVCVEGNGQQSLETLGAACCDTDQQLPADAPDNDPSSVMVSADGDDCGGCEDFLAVGDTDATRCEDTQPNPAFSTVLPPPAPPSITAWSIDGLLERSVRQSRARPPQLSPTIARLRSVTLRC